MAKSRKELKEFRQEQRRVKRGAKRADKRLYGRNKKKRAAAKAADIENRARQAQIESTEQLITEDYGGAAMYGHKKHGGSMKTNQSGGGYAAKHPGAPAKQLMRNQKDGGSMYGKKHGSSMYGKKHGSSMSGEKYDAKEAYNKNLKPSARLHYLENERHDKTHRHPILKHMKRF